MTPCSRQYPDRCRRSLQTGAQGIHHPPRTGRSPCTRHQDHPRCPCRHRYPCSVAQPRLCRRSTCGQGHSHRAAWRAKRCRHRQPPTRCCRPFANPIHRPRQTDQSHSHTRREGRKRFHHPQDHPHLQTAARCSNQRIHLSSRRPALQGPLVPVLSSQDPQPGYPDCLPWPFRPENSRSVHSPRYVACDFLSSCSHHQRSPIGRASGHAKH